jgi:hypothetical protein
VSRIMAKRGPRGNYPCILIQPIFLNLLLYMNLLILIECSQSQSLNTCKRVGVSGHIPKLLGTWGLSTIILGKCVSQVNELI